MDLRVGNKYRIGRKIGSGSFGDIYLGTNIISGEEIAIKLESVKAKHPQLEYEARVYKSLAGGVGIPFVRWFGTECDYNAMVLDLLGPSLEDLFNFCNRKFSLKTVLLLADQLISRIEYIHAKSFIHRDIKPDNFLMGIGKRGNQVNVIDFGLAKKYRDPKTHFHIPYRENKNLTGTARYASINTHLGVEQSRRDDMESLGYVMLYFCRGSLPWQGLKAATKKQKYDRIMEKKMTTPTEVLCRGFPNEFAIYLNYTRSLRFDDKPDYSYLRKIFRDLFVREGFQYDYVFDWTVYKYQKNAQAIAQASGNAPAAEEAEEKAGRTRHASATNQATAGNTVGAVTDKRRGPVAPRAEGSGILHLNDKDVPRSGEDVSRHLDKQNHGPDERAAFGQVTGQAEQDLSLDATEQSVAPEDVEAAHHSLTPEQAARQARQHFGHALPEDYLTADEYRAYERLYGPPVGSPDALDEELVDLEEGQVQGELSEADVVGTGILKEGKDGRLEEVEYLEEEEDVDEEELGDVEDAGQQDTSPEYLGLDAKTIADLEKLRLDEVSQEGDTDDGGYSTYLRSHPLTQANRFSTPSSTVQLPKSSFVDPVSILVSGLPQKHISEAAYRIFGGAGLPYSTSTPRRALTMPQKAIPLDPYQGRMTEMEADVYTAAIMPGVYASAYSILIETRKRLGSSWLEGLLNKEGGPRILDAGGAGAGILAVREVLRAEWERMHDTSDDPDAVMDIAEAGGETGGELLPAPVGRATVLSGSEALRQRASALLDNTSFLPRLPDYIHASDEQAKERGKFDIIIAPHTLWQIKEDHLRKTHVANLWSLLSTDGGVLILFEKGIPRGFEMVAAAREMLLEKRISSPGDEDMDEDIADPNGGTRWGKQSKDKGMIVAPCTNHYECPMYVKGSGVSKGRKDTCHFNQRYIRPPFLQKLLGAKDRNHEDVEFSYLSVMRGRDLRDKDSHGGEVVQGDSATEAAFAGYENPETVRQPSMQHELDPTAPAVPDVDEVYGTDPAVPHSLSLPRAVMPPMKRQGHVILDLCTPSGTLERWTVPKSFSKQAYRDARKSAWGDLWALGAKTRTLRNVRIGRKDGEGKAADHHPRGVINVKGRVKGADQEPGKKRRGAGGKNVVEVGYDSMGNIKEEDIKIRTGGRVRQGPKIKGIRDKRDKKATGHGRRKQGAAQDE
ncbi:hypothetical protein MBLNU459_g6635t2 [Dothideomycetes sp. NU459]